jgi:DNA-binding NarL/FixJ family response regulator
VSIRVLIADDQQLVRSGFRVLLDAEPDIEVVGEAADGMAAVAEARRLRPDIALMDIRMPRLDGIEATRSITNTLPGTRVIILTTYDLDEYVFDALRAGACGFLLKDVRTAELADAVRTVNDGGALLAPSITLRMISLCAKPRPRTARPVTGQADSPRRRGAQTCRPWPVQHRDRGPAHDQPGHHEDPRGTHPAQTGPP